MKPWGERLGQGMVNLLFAAGGLALLAGVLYAGYVTLQNWAIQQDQFLAANGIAPLSVPTITPTGKPSFTPTPLPTPTPPPRPVQISIPAIGVKSSIVSVLLVNDPRTGLLNWDFGSLFRPGRKDLVGHLEGTSLPGQPGNAVLGGHNWGYGIKGVFVHLGRLKARDRITVINEAGDNLVYEVVSVERVKWRRKTPTELARHLGYLAPTGKERLTLASCGGANFEPFPERIYVVARPVR